MTGLCAVTVDVSRWQPHASQRLVVPALDLFAAQAYENTTVIEIAKRSEVTKSTAFRHFSDKRQVLFGQDVVAGPLARGIAAGPPASTALEACRNHNRGKLSERPISDAAPRSFETPVFRLFMPLCGRS